MATQIVQASPTEAVLLTEIAFAAKRHWGYPEHWIAAWQDMLTITPEFIETHLVYQSVRDGQTLGFYALGWEGSDLSLEHLWVRPGLIGQGIGRELLAHGLAYATNLGAQSLIIEADPYAVGFYERMGARQVGERHSMIDGQPRILPVLTIRLVSPGDVLS